MAQKILVVEDEVKMLDILADVLGSAGYTVFKAMNGEDGVRLALTERPDLVIADLLLPGEMSGMMMIRKIREDEWGKNVKVMILTNVTDEKTIDEAIQQETFHYVIKGNITMETLLEKVKVQLGE